MYQHSPPSRLATSIAALLPEFAANLTALSGGPEGDPGDPVVLTALADFVAERLEVLHREDAVLTRALAVVDSVVDGSADEGTGSDLVGYAFFDSLSPDARRQLRPRLNPQGRELLEMLDQPPPC